MRFRHSVFVVACTQLPISAGALMTQLAIPSSVRNGSSLALVFAYIVVFSLLADPCRAQSAATAKDDTSIRPFSADVSDEALADLKRRIAATRWPEKETVTDATQGVQLATMKQLARYWETEYDWRKIEAKLKALPQFVTTIDGLDIHFIHVKSQHPNALPIIVTHGWPGSVIEQIKIIDPLVNPTAHGGKAEDAFDVIVPAMPGYGYSGKPTTTGWDAPRIASAWGVLMQRLGYEKYVAQGGDWGALVVDQMGVQKLPGLVAIQTSMPGAVPPAVDQAAFTGAPPPPGLAADEKHAYDQLAFFYKHGLAYAQEMGNRPQTLYGIEDSPAGLAGWILDHDIQSYELIARVFAGQKEGLTRDDILDNITHYWLTKTGVSSARLYWENKLAFFAPKGVEIPVAASACPTDIYTAPRSWVEKAYPNLIRYHLFPKCGHFAAWEQPELFVDELRTSFAPLR
jgi:pimeloyl-ACP methyl ester carboxylesterase